MKSVFDNWGVKVANTLQGMSLTDKQVSALFSLVKTVHTQAVLQRLTIDKSFDCFKQALLRHSVHRSESHTKCYHNFRT